MNHSVKVGVSFGLTSGIITTLGLLVGLTAFTHSKLIVIGGILTIAIADSLSDALGIHVSEEAEGKHTEKEIWASTFATLLTKFIVAMTFTIPFMLLSLSEALILSVIWGLLLLSVFSYLLERKIQPVIEHLTIAALVVVITYFVGNWISTVFM